MSQEISYILILVIVPVLFAGTILYGLFHKKKEVAPNKQFQVPFTLKHGSFKADNIRRGVSIIGSAGSGKTQSVVYNLLRHFSAHNFCGVIHDYKDFELTEIAIPLFKGKDIKLLTVAFGRIQSRVNPIAPCYLPDEESVNEVSRVLMENLLEQNLTEAGASNKFFSDAVEGLLSGLIWRMKTEYPQYCTLPHVMAIFQLLPTRRLVAFLKSDLTSRSMASAFLNGIESEKQTAGVKSTLANAFKKIGSKKLFYVLSQDEISLDINNPDHPAVVSLVNDPQYETAYSPAIALIIHTIIKQMSVRNRMASFILMEEAPTIKLPAMHRIPATLRSYDVCTIYVMQDKIQNDMLYGEKASRAILSNLSYQFFGKVNDPDTAKYYERFFEIVKKQTTSVSKGHNLNFDTRITKGERESPKIMADVFFRLKPGEFIAYADGRDKKVEFKLGNIKRELPSKTTCTGSDIQANFERIYAEAASLFKSK